MSQPLTSPLPAPVGLGFDLVFAAADGIIYRWADELQPHALWSNPDGAQLDCKWIPLAKDQVGFVARRPEGSMDLIKIGLQESKAQFMERIPLPQHVCAMDACQGTLGMLVAEPGEFLRVEVWSLSPLGWKEQYRHSFRATDESWLCSCQFVPWQGQPHLLIRYCEGQQQNFYLLQPGGGVDEVKGKPHKDEPVQVVWEGDQVWQVYLNEGRIKPLEIAT